MSDPRVGFAIVGLLALCALLLLANLFKSGPSGPMGSAVDLGGLVEWLQGKKTYIGMVLLAINNYASRKGWMDAQLATDLNIALGTLTGIAFVAKTNRIEQKTETAVTAAKIAAVVRPEGPVPKEGI